MLNLNLCSENCGRKIQSDRLKKWSKIAILSPITFWENSRSWSWSDLRSLFEQVILMWSQIAKKVIGQYFEHNVMFNFRWNRFGMFGASHQCCVGYENRRKFCTSNQKIFCYGRKCWRHWKCDHYGRVQFLGRSWGCLYFPTKSSKSCSDRHMGTLLVIY